jgi:galactose mutarotase-like enzyme
MVFSNGGWKHIMISIENKTFRASIRLKGAELASLQHKASGCELMWQADPEIWGGSAPILFPIIGKLKNGKTNIGGTEYEIPKHGLIRNLEATPIEQSSDSVRLRFESNVQTLETYPFSFVFDVIFQLTETGLAVDYEVTNSGDETMRFTIGSHPAFALDAVLGSSIEFSQPETLDLYGLSAKGLLFKRVGRWFKREQLIQLSDRIFKDGALIFKNIQSHSIRLKTAGDRPILEIDLRNHPHLGLWSKPGAPFVCIEPWYGFDDASNSDGIFENKPNMLTLEAGNTFQTGYAVRVAD